MMEEPASETSNRRSRVSSVLPPPVKSNGSSASREPANGRPEERRELIPARRRSTRELGLSRQPMRCPVRSIKKAARSIQEFLSAHGPGDAFVPIVAMPELRLLWSNAAPQGVPAIAPFPPRSPLSPEDQRSSARELTSN